MRFSQSWRDGARAARRGSFVALVAATVAFGCRARPAEDGRTYHPFYMPAATLTSAEPRGTLKGDYVAARASTTPDEALARWHEFLQKHEPPNGEYEDAFQRNYIRAAQYELMRISYLTGHAAEGDVLLRRLEDVQSGR